MDGSVLECEAIVTGKVPLADLRRLVDLAERCNLQRGGRPNLSAALRLALGCGLDVLAGDPLAAGQVTTLQNGPGAR